MSKHTHVHAHNVFHAHAFNISVRTEHEHEHAHRTTDSIARSEDASRLHGPHEHSRREYAALRQKAWGDR